MVRRIVFTFIVLCSCALMVNAQQGKDDMNITRGVKDTPGEQKAEGGKSPPAVAYIVAIAATLIILAIICTPSRRQ
jgi:hypothetical protein